MEYETGILPIIGPVAGYCWCCWTGRSLLSVADGDKLSSSRRSPGSSAWLHGGRRQGETRLSRGICRRVLHSDAGQAGKWRRRLGRVQQDAFVPRVWRNDVWRWILPWRWRPGCFTGTDYRVVLKILYLDFSYYEISENFQSLYNSVSDIDVPQVSRMVCVSH